MEKSDKIIGGEYEIDPTLAIDNKQSTDITPFGRITDCTGRQALYHILLNEDNKENVLMPDYVCESVCDAARRAKKSIEPYHIGMDFQCNMSELVKLIESADISKSILLIVNYFGLIDIENLVDSIKKQFPELTIIVDNVQSLYSMQTDCSADYMFTSFRKWLPVPDGATIITNKELILLEQKENMFAQEKFLAATIKYKKHVQGMDDVDDKVYLHQFDMAEKHIEFTWNEKVSHFTKNIIPRLDFTSIKKQRRMNAEYICSSLLGSKVLRQNAINFLNYLQKNRNFVPMFVPLFLNDKDNIRRKLIEKNIFCPTHWPMNNAMARQELSLVIDQRYDSEDMIRIGKELVDLIG